jgi:FlaA1/EpsC-like NDP-sugar epimerase
MLNFLSIRNNTPRWFILIIDLAISFTSIVSAYFLRFNFKLPEEYFNLENIQSFYFVIPVVLVIRFLSFLISRTYQGLVRYTSTKDAGRIFFVLIIGSLLFGIINIITYEVRDIFFIPISVIGIDFLANVFLMTGSRFFVKALYLDYAINSKEKQNALVFGISELALITKRTLSQDIGSLYKVVAFVDSTNTHAGKKKLMA